MKRNKLNEKKLSKRDEKILQITFAESQLKKQGISGFVE